MSKVAIVTILDNTNYGTYLQALATGLCIKKLGHEVEVVHYTRPFMTVCGRFKSYLREGITKIIKSGWRIPQTVRHRSRDYQYLQKFVPVTSEYCGFSELQKNPPVADIYMTGSDQVWNSIYNRGTDRTYFLDFAPKGKKRVAYAASIGMDRFPDEEVSEVKALLAKYSAITVREADAVETLGKIGIISEVVLDPTLLLDNKQWSEIASKDNMDFDEPYLLLYTVEKEAQNRLIEHYAKQVAKKYGLKIYQVSYDIKRKSLPCADKVFAEATPDIFLNLMKKASYVIVSSFHGTAFAINFNKPFLTIAANRFNSRVNNLLNITALQHRLITDEMQDIDSISDIDYEKVNQRLADERKSSVYKLKRMVEQ